jgi:hypothetical protein
MKHVKQVMLSPIYIRNGETDSRFFTFFSVVYILISYSDSKEENMEQNVRVLSDLVTYKSIMALFGRSLVTVRMWHKYEGMPYVRIPGDGRDSIRFDIKEVKKWAKKNGKEIIGHEG